MREGAWGYNNLWNVIQEAGQYKVLSHRRVHTALQFVSTLGICLTCITLHLHSDFELLKSRSTRLSGIGVNLRSHSR